MIYMFFFQDMSTFTFDTKSTEIEVRCQICKQTYEKPIIRPQQQKICSTCIEKQLEICNQGHRKEIQCFVCQNPENTSNVVFLKDITNTANWRQQTDTVACKNPVTSTQVDAEVDGEDSESNMADPELLKKTEACDDPISYSNVVKNKTNSLNNEMSNAVNFGHPMNCQTPPQNSPNGRQPQEQHMVRQQEPNSPTVSQQQPNSSIVSQQQPNSPIVSQQQPNSPAVSHPQAQPMMSQQHPSSPNGHNSRFSHPGSPPSYFNVVPQRPQYNSFLSPCADFRVRPQGHPRDYPRVQHQTSYNTCNMQAWNFHSPLRLPWSENLRPYQEVY